jgi:DNA repair protein RadC
MSNFQTALVQLPLVRESTGERVRTPEDVYRVCGDIAHLAQEAFTVLALDVKNYLINRHLVSLGLADASLVHPREVYRPVLSDGASAIICVHAHPSGDPTPSAEDLRITRQLIEAGRIIDIKVLDHVVIGRPHSGSPGFMSMRESGLCAFA